MAYSQQSFSNGEILASTKMNQIELNVRDHQHGIGGIENDFGPIKINSIYIGDRSLHRSIAIGLNALATAPSSENIAIGNGALGGLSNGRWNTVIGNSAINSTTTTDYSVIIGFEACKLGKAARSVIIGAISAPNVTSVTGRNTIIGYNTCNSANQFSSSVVIGYNACESVNSGSSNVFVGDFAGRTAAGGAYSFCIGIGPYALGNTGVSSRCVGIGYQALYDNAGGYGNIGVGCEALENVTDGFHNTAVGDKALDAVTSYSNCSGLGYNTAVTGNDQVQLGNSSTTTYAYGAVQDRSDKRDKADISQSSLGLTFIRSLNPVQFRWDYREDYNWEEKTGDKKRKRLHQGLIAQEVETTCNSFNVEFGGLQHHAKKGGKDVYSIGYTELVAPLINAIKELTERVEKLEKKLKEK